MVMKCHCEVLHELHIYVFMLFKFCLIDIFERIIISCSSIIVLRKQVRIDSGV